MAPITRISFNVQTADKDGAGTDGNVYLGFGGREFRADTDHDDFEQDSSREYIFGERANVNNPGENDPRNPQLQTENTERFPIYVRFQPTGGSDNWKLLRAEVSLNDALFPRWDTGDYISFRPDGGIWLGIRSGLVVYIPLHADGTGVHQQS